jgi:peroxiredoxin
MLAIGTRPPAFTLADHAGHRVALGAFLGQRRLLVVFDPDREYLERVRRHRAAFEDREVLVVAVVPEDSPLAAWPSAEPILVAHDEHGRVHETYGAASPCALLVGKDGTVKDSWTGLPPDAEVLAKIDAMPMRRQEVLARVRARAAARRAAPRVPHG